MQNVLAQIIFAHFFGVEYLAQYILTSGIGPAPSCNCAKIFYAKLFCARKFCAKKVSPKTVYAKIVDVKIICVKILVWGPLKNWGQINFGI